MIDVESYLRELVDYRLVNIASGAQTFQRVAQKFEAHSKSFWQKPLAPTLLGQMRLSAEQMLFRQTLE
uniref:Uncharacterized protein n=1 Tax=Romanomermis culicivorax TaxID=13658 RepID=A0A915HLT8_ROMCU